MLHWLSERVNITLDYHAISGQSFLQLLKIDGLVGRQTFQALSQANELQLHSVQLSQLIFSYFREL